jgi:FkbM family methyltransferase
MDKGKGLAPQFRVVSYAGNAEDVVLLRAFAARRGGFFVDVGAGEPDSGSVTKNLVDRLGWWGVNIEPLPERHARLVAARPGDVNLKVAVGSVPGQARFHRVVAGPGQTGGGGLSTLREEVAAMHRGDGWRTQEFEVEVVTLESVLVAYAPVGFDVLKVDVEGAEADVLASVDLERWRPRAVVVEATVPLTTEPSHQAWEPGLLAAGYVLTLFDGLNRWYAREEEADLRVALSVPANSLDRWIPAGWAALLGYEV